MIDIDKTHTETTGNTKKSFNTDTIYTCPRKVVHHKFVISRWIFKIFLLTGVVYNLSIFGAMALHDRFSFIYFSTLCVECHYVQTRHKVSGASAALKQVQISDESELDDYSVEIDILTHCTHRNVVQLYEAYFFNGKLMVSWLVKWMNERTFIVLSVAAKGQGLQQYVYRVRQKSGPLKFFAVFSATVWNFSLKFYCFIE